MVEESMSLIRKDMDNIKIQCLRKKKIHWMALRLNTMGENDSKLGIIANYSKNIRIYQNAFYLIYFFLWGGIN